MKFQSTTSHELSLTSTTVYNKETSGIKPHFPLNPQPSHFPVATSLLSPLLDYISHTKCSNKIDSTFEDLTMDVILEPTTPIIAMHGSHTSSVNTPTLKNVTTAVEFDQKHPKNTESPIFTWADEP